MCVYARIGEEDERNGAKTIHIIVLGSYEVGKTIRVIVLPSFYSVRQSIALSCRMRGVQSKPRNNLGKTIEIIVLPRFLTENQEKIGKTIVKIVLPHLKIK